MPHHPCNNGRSISMFTPRQREILGHLAQGAKTREVAAILGVSPKTIETHMWHLRRNLGLRNMNQLIVFATWRLLTFPAPMPEEHP